MTLTVGYGCRVWHSTGVLYVDGREDTCAGECKKNHRKGRSPHCAGRILDPAIPGNYKLPIRPGENCKRIPGAARSIPLCLLEIIRCFRIIPVE